MSKTTLRVKVDANTLRGVGLDDISSTEHYSWSDANPPWAYTSTSQFRATWPNGVTVVPIQTGSSDFWTNLSNTVVAAGARIVVELGEGVYHLDKFRVIGASGKKAYSFGFWFPNLQGLVGQGPDKTFVQLDANATTVDLDGTTNVTSMVHDEMSEMTQASFSPIQRSLCRIDGSVSSPVIISGLTFRAADQLPITEISPDITGNVFLPQPSPHNGVIIYDNWGNLGAYVSYVRFQGAGRGMTSQPPFECANAQTGRGTVYWNNCEFDGRRSIDLDIARPRRCGVVMVNGETLSDFTDCWFHHSNISRYASNDQNRAYSGIYNLTRCKSEQITNTLNTDPALNGGNSLGGYTNATPFGWESSSATITVRDCIVHQDNPNPLSGTGQIPMMFQLTSVGGVNPQGGRFYVYGGDYHWVHSQLEGFVGFRISNSTYWWMDGFATTLFVYHKDGQRLAPYQVTGMWPPSAEALAGAGVTPETHYLIRAT